MSAIQHFDVIAVGGGSGLTAAWHALQENCDVALVTDQPEALGGTCVNFGCIPTKTLLQSAELMDSVRHAERFGIHLDQASVQVDFARIMQQMRHARAEAVAGVRRWVETEMTPIFSRVRFIDERTLESADGQRLTADHIFLATGARPVVPEIPGLAEAGYWTNEEVLELEAQPASLVIIGGGYIAAELGYFFAALGTRVTLISRSPRLLTGEDDEISERFTRAFGERVELVTGEPVEARATATQRQVVVATADGGERVLAAEQLLVATGRRANTEGLEAETGGIELDAQGAIRVDEQLRTRNPRVFAYGDVIGRAMFKHTSSYEGGLAWRNARGAGERVDYRSNPHAVFSHPQIGAVGLTERECRARALDYRVTTREYGDVARGRIIGAPDGLARLLVERGSERILGFHMLGPGAAELIHEVVVAMNAGDGSTASVRRSIHVHPTLPELVRAVFDAD
ncbi:dihydrolipoamide dehydrogenase [Kushneria sinocarnis]|uniref:Dihydrolipoamide dehydrogenase n=1 Tax=Kushneria sinocarnis TaxID=595502 RepID=A0A420X0Y3_9GAMM|nr:dihydrolipoyl dehydrogenase [Kushneria sinocarnis]RKR07359.1 dihydrolipoamide dehydrogenase [Kushneria sinocarnis]